MQLIMMHFMVIWWYALPCWHAW